MVLIRSSNMSKALYSRSVLITIIGVSIITNVSAQPTVDEDEAYCQSTTWEGAAKEIKANLRLTIRDELAEVKNLLGSRQQPCESGASYSSSLCEYKIHSLLICISSPAYNIKLCGVR